MWRLSLGKRALEVIESKVEQPMQLKKMIAASVLSADFARLGEEIKAVEKAKADWIHFDITDGHFVQNLTMGTLAVKAARKSTSLPLDVHLMIENPERFVQMFAEAGADYISVHYESTLHLNRVVQLIRNCNVHPGVAIGPTVPPEQLRWILEYIDYVLVLTVNPGFGGQKIISNSAERIQIIAKMIEMSGRDILIQADGGVNLDTVKMLSDAGVNVFTVWSALFGSENYGVTIENMHKAMAK